MCIFNFPYKSMCHLGVEATRGGLWEAVFDIFIE